MKKKFNYYKKHYTIEIVNLTLTTRKYLLTIKKMKEQEEYLLWKQVRILGKDSHLQIIVSEDELKEQIFTINFNDKSYCEIN